VPAGAGGWMHRSGLAVDRLMASSRSGL
jgi:hypothetical protein